MTFRAISLMSGLSLAALVGCGEADFAPPPDDSPAVKVMFQSSPLADVHVRLHASPDGPAIVQAITGADGRALFGDVPSPEPDQYHVSLESISDGGWMLDPKVIAPTLDSLRLGPLSQNQTQAIDLPPRAVRSLSKTR